MELNDQIRLKIMKLRDEKGMTQAQLAEKLGISRSHMNKLENGKLQISLPFLKQMAAVLSVPLSELFEENGVIVHKTSIPFDFKGVNQAIMELEVDDDYLLTMYPKDLLVTEEKLNRWKEQAHPGSIIIGSYACRYLIITTDTKPDPSKPGFLIPTYGFVNIDHAGWELCGPRFDSCEEMIEWFASCIDNPIIDVISSSTLISHLPGEEYV